MYKISIIIPFFNTKSEYLYECINSALNQSYENIEVMLINDGSTITYNFKQFKDNQKLIILGQNHLGVSAARNLGIRHATGDYLMFLDSDDWLEVDACKKFISVADKYNSPEIIIAKCKLHRSLNNIESNFSTYGNGYVKNKQELIDSIFKNLKVKYTCVDTPWAKLYLKSFLIENEINFNEKLSNGEDGLFNFCAYTKASLIYFTTDEVYNYRFNQYSVCSSYCPELDLKFRKLYVEYEKVFLENHVESNFQNLYFLAIRNLCRLLRKFYNKIDSYLPFKDALAELLKTKEFKEPLNKIKMNILDRGKRKVVRLCKLRCYRTLYKMSKNGFKIK